MSTGAHSGQATVGRHHLALPRDINDFGFCDSVPRTALAIDCDERDARRSRCLAVAQQAPSADLLNVNIQVSGTAGKRAIPRPE